jgi:hypothetical protein
MALIEWGDSASTNNNLSSIFDVGSVMTEFNVDDWGGNTDPISGRKLYVVYSIHAWAKYYDTTGTEKLQFIAGTSNGGTQKLTATDGEALTTSAYAWVKCRLAPDAADKMFLLGDGVQYWIGVYSPSSSGFTTKRKANTNPGRKVRTLAYGASTLWSNFEQTLRIYMFGLPNKVTGVTATATTSTSVNVSWTAGTVPDPTEGYITKYRVQYSTSSSFSSPTTVTSSGTGTSYLVTGLSANTTYYFRVAAQNRVSELGSFSTASGPWSNSVSVSTVPAVASPVFSGSYVSGTQSVFYSDYVTASGADTITVKSGKPSWATAYQSGTRFYLEGTPNTATSYTVTLTATNAGGSVDGTFSFSVAAPPPPANPVWGSGTFATFFVGVSYSSLVSATNATSYALSGLLPAGLSLNTSTGRISGTPQQPASPTEMSTYTFTVTAYGATGTTPASKTFTVNMRFPGRVFTNDSGGSDNPRIARRLDESQQWVPIQSVKRFNGTAWEIVDLI